VPNWPDHVTGDEMVAAMDKVDVDGALGRNRTYSWRDTVVLNIDGFDGPASKQFRYCERVTDAQIGP
jgi:hypothetical protein